jgi:serine O-acetyltransferase
VQNSILGVETIMASLARILSAKLATPDVPAKSLNGIFMSVYQTTPNLEPAAQHDLISVMQNDPAAHDFITPFLFFKGYHALQGYRIANFLWHQGRQHMALYLQNRISELLDVDIHPAATIGHGVMLDHATGIVIGETAVVENDVLMWHGVTLGGRTINGGDRHPKVRQGAQLGSGAGIFGPVEIGAGARVAAGSVVLENVPANVTVAGVPAKVVGEAKPSSAADK